MFFEAGSLGQGGAANVGILLEEHIFIAVTEEGRLSPLPRVVFDDELVLVEGRACDGIGDALSLVSFWKFLLFCRRPFQRK